jgi:hypothetical protein
LGRNAHAGRGCTEPAQPHAWTGHGLASRRSQTREASVHRDHPDHVRVPVVSSMYVSCRRMRRTSCVRCLRGSSTSSSGDAHQHMLHGADPRPFPPVNPAPTDEQKKRSLNGKAISCSRRVGTFFARCAMDLLYSTTPPPVGGPCLLFAWRRLTHSEVAIPSIPTARANDIIIKHTVTFLRM